jgi:hypothetical protein
VSDTFDFIPNEQDINNNPESVSTPEADIVATETAEKLTFKSKLRERGFFSPYFMASVIIFLFSTVVYVISRLSSDFAEFWTRYPAYWLKFLQAKLTTVFSFSIAEWLLISLPFIVIWYLVASWRAMNRAEKQSDFYKWLLPLISLLFLIISDFFLAFGPAYFRYPLEKNLSIEKKAVSAEELYETAVKITEEMNADIDSVKFIYNGASIMPYSYKELSEKLNTAYKKYADKVEYVDSFKSYPKPIVLSELLTYTHISGVYSFMTGEANVNTNYPDFILPYTMAHEMSHQRGIAKEDEANFVAFLVCRESDDPYIRYSGYSNMLNYLMNSLSEADSKLYSQYYTKYYPIELKGEYSSYSTFFDKYRESKASEVTGTVNNVFLGSQGQKEGIKSYGLVVDLTVAYYKGK